MSTVDIFADFASCTSCGAMLHRTQIERHLAWHERLWPVDGKVKGVIAGGPKLVEVTDPGES